MFYNPSGLICGILGLQLALVFLQGLVLLRSSEWYHYVSISLLLFSNYHTLFKLVRNYFVCWRVYRAEQVIQSKNGLLKAAQWKSPLLYILLYFIYERTSHKTDWIIGWQRRGFWFFLNIFLLCWKLISWLMVWSYVVPQRHFFLNWRTTRGRTDFISDFICRSNGWLLAG